MPKDPVTPERYAVEVMQMAIGALECFVTEHNGVNNVIERLRRAVDKFDPRCDHEWVGAQSPRGGVEGTCKKCGVTRYVS